MPEDPKNFCLSGLNFQLELSGRYAHVVKNRWARGIPPRNFSWILKESLAVSERPGGYARNHRRVRRQEEIIWIREEGFQRVVSLLGSPHNLHAYEEFHVPYSHVPFGETDDPAVVLPELYRLLRGWIQKGERILIHQEELGDRMMGVVAGYLLWSGTLPTNTQAIVAVERLLSKQMGPEGRELVATIAGTKA